VQLYIPHLVIHFPTNQNAFPLDIWLAALTPLARAIPIVTPVLAGGCAAYPNYDASTSIAGPWILQLNSCENSTIEGYGDNSQLIRAMEIPGSTRGASPLSPTTKSPRTLCAATVLLLPRLWRATSPLGYQGMHGSK
jgi:hypothetical protein